MAAHFHPLRIKDIKQETAESIILTFDVPENLEEIFQYTPGQNLTLKTTINGEELRRSYSICSAPHEHALSIAVKRVESGKFSHHANEYLQIGDVLEVLPPTGRFFTKPDPSNSKKYLAIAAGSGITPIISIIKNTLATEPLSKFTLVYGNKTRHSIMFFEELEAIKNRYLQRFQFINILSREATEVPITQGRIDKEKLAALSRLVDYQKTSEVFICGPEPMLFCAKEFLEENGLQPKNIHFELFNTPGQKIAANGLEKVTEPPIANSQVQVKLDGRTFQFDLAFNSESILDAALKQGADLPYACKGGVCSTCRAKLVEGKVSMDNNYALETEEVDAGFILTCQSHPITEKVRIDYDSR